jgi:hypothetical protein
LYLRRRTVHNLAVALLSLDPDEGPLLDYLSRAGRDPLGRPLYDAKYALRLARDRDRCVRDAERVYRVCIVVARVSFCDACFEGGKRRGTREAGVRIKMDA